MPKKVINDYTFYKIVCLDDSCDLCYVGSTANWNERRRNHKSNCNNENNRNYNQKIYKSIRENGGWDNFKMIEIGKAEQLTKRQAEQIEEEYRINLKANMNCKRCYLTEEQQDNYDKLYREENKDKIKQLNKEWREANKEHLKEHKKEYQKNNKEHIKEYQKKYNEDNREHKIEYNKKYRLQNQDKLLEYDNHRYYNDIKRQEYFKRLVVCECGFKGTNQHLSRHKRSQKHINLMNNLVQK